ncbi:MAG TPA: hypothetical protein VMU31_02480 [Rhizomicrobium sp.]|nr:hypothetical protein [Rhizomicrobium sp.]
MGRAQIGAQLQEQRVTVVALECQRHQLGDIAFHCAFGQAQFRARPKAQKLVAPDHDAELHLLVMGPFGFEGSFAFVKSGHDASTPVRPARFRGHRAGP